RILICSAPGRPPLGAKPCRSRRIALTVSPATNTPMHWKPPSLVWSITASCLIDRVEFEHASIDRSDVAAGCSAPKPAMTGEIAITNAVTPARAVKGWVNFQKSCAGLTVDLEPRVHPTRGTHPRT